MNWFNGYPKIFSGMFLSKEIINNPSLKTMTSFFFFFDNKTMVLFLDACED